MYEIKKMTKNDWERVSKIYQQGMDTNLATFQISCPSYEEFDASHLDQRYVILDNNLIIGWTTLAPISNRPVYSGIAEVSIYIDQDYQGKGVATELLNYMIEESEKHGFWMLQSSIFENNIGSIKLHEKCGFRKVGYREKIGKDSFGEWRNTILMERRSHLTKFN